MKNVLESLTEFLGAHFNDIHEEVAPELRFSPGFMSLARDFDKIFSLCEKSQRVLARYFVNG